MPDASTAVSKYNRKTQNVSMDKYCGKQERNFGVPRSVCEGRFRDYQAAVSAGLGQEWLKGFQGQ